MAKVLPRNPLNEEAIEKIAPCILIYNVRIYVANSHVDVCIYVYMGDGENVKGAFKASPGD